MVLFSHLDRRLRTREVIHLTPVMQVRGFPGGTSGKEPTNARDLREVGLIPGSRRSLGEGNGNTLQYSRLENAVDKGAWPATIHRVAQSRERLKQLNTHTCRLERASAAIQTQVCLNRKLIFFSFSSDTFK